MVLKTVKTPKFYWCFYPRLGINTLVYSYKKYLTLGIYF